MSDPVVPHDHPWNYLSIILWGGYWEYSECANCYEVKDNGAWFKTIWYGPGSFLFRKGDKLHKLIIPEGEFSISLIFTSKKWRDWGFIEKEGWYSHKQRKPY